MTMLQTNPIVPFPSAPIAANDMSDIDLLAAISGELIGEQDRMELYGKIVDAAITITQSQYGTMQVLCPEGDPSGHGGDLGLLCSRRLPEDAIGFWRWVSPAAHSSCTQALKTGRRAVIADYEAWEEIAGTPDLMAFRHAGIRSAQTTPLFSRGGDLLGMISTHWSAPHEPSERDLRLLDILARQAADLLERTIAEEALRVREQELDRTCAALRESEELQTMLTGELSHRVKNMLATVQAIATQTLRHSDKPENFVESFGGRIQSMSRVHSQLSSSDWKGSSLRDVVHDQMKLGPVDETQIEVRGPDVHLAATDVTKMAMILHELGTNSLKYGALSRTDGGVIVAWDVEDSKLHLRWSEHGGPKIEGPIRRGFGSRLIQASVPALGGSATMSVELDGVCWEIAFPLRTEQTRNDDQSAASSTAARVPISGLGLTRGTGLQAILAGKRILVVEDEPLLAMDMVAQIEDAGAVVIGPAASASIALTLIEEYRIDAALLDANLDGQPVDDIATSLASKAIPFAFVSGYGRESLPQAFKRAKLLPKPFNADQLRDLASTLFP